MEIKSNLSLLAFRKFWKWKSRTELSFIVIFSDLVFSLDKRQSGKSSTLAHSLPGRPHGAQVGDSIQKAAVSKLNQNH